MRPAVATVLSPRPWESHLVGVARRTANVRIVGRAYDPEDLLAMGSVDTVVIGSETAWLSPALLRSWRTRGWRVLGLHPEHDTPGRDRLLAGGADLVVPDHTSPEYLLRTMAAWGAEPMMPASSSRVITVTGARGAPGRTTIAVALMHAAAPGTILLDADPLPNVAVALGLGPGPDLDALIDDLRNDTGFVGLAHPEDGIAVLCPETAENPMAGALVCELAMTMRGSFETVILETGPPSMDLPRMLRCADSSVLVAEGTTQGIVRAAHLLQDWPVDPPAVVVNRIRGDLEDVVRSCRSAFGLEPDVLLPHFGRDPVQAALPYVDRLVAE